jgi:hypothetical protein
MLRLKTILGTALLLSLLAAQASAEVVCEGLTAQHPLTYRSPTYGYSLAYPASMEIAPDSISDPVCEVTGRVVACDWDGRGGAASGGSQLG